MSMQRAILPNWDGQAETKNETKKSKMLTHGTRQCIHETVRKKITPGPFPILEQHCIVLTMSARRIATLSRHLDTAPCAEQQQLVGDGNALSTSWTSAHSASMPEVHDLEKFLTRDNQEMREVGLPHNHTPDSTTYFHPT
jgi:hypothetical protein